MNCEVSRIRAAEGETRNPQRRVAQVRRRDGIRGARGDLGLCAEAGRRPPESLGYLPVPVKLTVCGLLGSLSAMTRVADRTPVLVGLNAK